MESIIAQALGQDINKIGTLEKQELLSRLLARLAHEIRNPLSSLHIHVQLLQEDVARTVPELAGQFAARFEILHGELNRMETIVKQFVSLSGPAMLQVEEIDVTKLIASVCALLQPEAAARSISLDNTSSGPARMRGDPAQLTQALVNLAINAVQAIERGGSVTMRASTDEGTGRVTIEVQDTGPGIDPANLSVVFEPFFTTKREGSGLGLWIVQQIVSAHRGTMRVSNVQPRGALFAIELPVNAA